MIRPGRVAIFLTIWILGCGSAYALQIQQRDVLLDEMISLTNRLFDAVAQNDQRMVDRLIISNAQRERELSERPVIASGTFATDLAPLQTGAPAETEVQVSDPLRDISFLRTAFTGLKRPATISVDLDPELPSISLNFHCPGVADGKCISHLYLFFRRDGDLLITSYISFMDSPDWEELWNSNYSKGLTTIAVKEGLFRLPLSGSSGAREP